MSERDARNAEGGPDPTVAGLTAQRASTLLRLGLSRPVRGIDDVVRRLGPARTPDWLDAALRRLPASSAEDAADRLARGGAPLADLQTWKAEHKRVMQGAASADERAASILLYYLCIAAASLHHGELITGQSRLDVGEALLDLAGAMHEPWSTFLGRAAAGLHAARE